MRSLTLRLAGSLPFVAVAVLACSPTSSGSTSAPAVDTGYTPIVTSDAGACTTDDDCSDFVFCNGIERCNPGDPQANSRGCIRPQPWICMPGQRCSEGDRRCYSDCGHDPDADGDGHRSMDCGGDDCDDSDRNRFPGNREVCANDAPEHDEDCDATTFGDTDVDRDGYVAARCCNVASNGTRFCGLDCDDNNAGVHPGLPELCNGVDDNCNGTIDEGVKITLYVDADHDGYGAPGPGSLQCPGATGYSALGNDCDDTNAAITPGSMKCDDPQVPSTVLLCNPNTGAFVSSFCAKGTATCLPQPNGTGICVP